MPPRKKRLADTLPALIGISDYARLSGLTPKVVRTVFRKNGILPASILKPNEKAYIAVSLVEKVLPDFWDAVERRWEKSEPNEPK
jgi:hypothetical protein